jgi:5-formyltetrahydrofolate cyclo-ligase
MTEIVSEAKAKLRTQVLSNRSAKMASETAGQIGTQLLKLCSQLGAKSVGIYLSFGSEPVTDAFVVAAKAAGISLSAPRTGPDSSMEFARLEGPTKSSEIVEPDELDLIIAPALSVDLSGNRLGRGGGFFDRYLEQFDGPVAGVVYENELVPELPSEPHDKPVQYAVTPSKIQPLTSKQ